MALLSNEIQFFVENPLIAVPNIRNGKVRALAVTSAAEYAKLVKEIGYQPQ